jgi:carotenoid cleavage dioxygenase-like enzyme
MTQAMGRMRTRFQFLEIDPGCKVVSSREGEIDGLSITHDFLVTPSFYVVLEGAVTVDPVQYVKARLGVESIVNAIKQRPRSGRALLVPRGGGAARIIDLGQPVFAVHHVNAWEQDGRVVLLTCAFERVSLGHEFGFQGPFAPLDPGVRFPADGQRLLRFEIDPSSGATTRREVSPFAIDFPRVHPERDGLSTRYMVGACARRAGAPDPFDSVALVDLERETTALWSAGPGAFVGEPLFVPRDGATGEGDAWILVMVYDGRAGRSSLCILDAARVEAGPVATLRLPVLLPYGFHGHWQQAAA